MKKSYENEFLDENQVWPIYGNVFGVKESNFDIRFEIWPILREMGAKRAFLRSKMDKNTFSSKWQKCSCNVTRNMFFGVKKIFFTYVVTFNPIYARWGPKKHFWGKKKVKKKVKNDKNVKILPVRDIRIHIVTTKIHLG